MRFESKYDGAFIEDKLNNRTYCCDSQNDWLSICDLLNELSEKEVEVHKHPLFSTRLAEEKIERYESDLRMCREKALYWRNKAEDIFGDMRTNVGLKRENEQLKREVKRLKCINKQLEERLDKDIVLNMDCGDLE